MSLMNTYDQSHDDKPENEMNKEMEAQVDMIGLSVEMEIGKLLNHAEQTANS